LPTLRGTLQAQTDEDLLVRALRGPLQPHEVRYEYLIEGLKATLKRRLPDPTTASGDTPDSPAPQEESGVHSFPFLLPPQAPDEIGRLGGYRVLGLFGKGGMGMVFCAEDPGLGRLIALKVIKPSRRVSPEARQRFLSEARSLGALEHDHIVTVYQVGEDNGVPFLAMQLLKGETLQARLERTQEPLPIDEVLRMGVRSRLAWPPPINAASCIGTSSRGMSGWSPPPDLSMASRGA
jgi:hypothetical protein